MIHDCNRVRYVGVDTRPAGTDPIQPKPLQSHHRRSQRTSWWRNICNRMSQPGTEPVGEMFTKPAKRNSRALHHSRDFDRTSLLYEYDDPPPLSIIHAHRSNRQSRDSRNVDAATDIGDMPVPDMSMAQAANHAREPTDILGPLPTSLRRSAPPEGGSHMALTSPGFDRSDSLLARVFPHSSPGLSSVELGSAASVSSQSTNKPRAQARAAKLRLTTNPSVVIDPGNDPGRALVSSPVPLQMSPGPISDKNFGTIAHPQSLVLSTSAELGMAPPPVPPKPDPRGSDDTPTRHESPPLPDERPSRSSHRRESAGHRASHPSYSHPSSMPSPSLKTTSAVPRTGDRAPDNSNTMGLYRTGNDDPRIWESREDTERLDSTTQHNHASPPIRRNSPRIDSRPDVVSPARQIADMSAQQPTNATDLHRQRLGFSRRPPTGRRSHRHISAPLDIAPAALHSHAGYRSRHSVDNNANLRQLTIPAPLAPNAEAKPIRDLHHAYFPIHRSSDFTRFTPPPNTHASSNSRYHPSQEYYNVARISNPLPLMEVRPLRPHRTRHRDSARIDIRTTLPL
jgi:hypothetical protein